MIRKFFIMQLKRGFEEEYERRQNPIWKALGPISPMGEEVIEELLGAFSGV